MSVWLKLIANSALLEKKSRKLGREVSIETEAISLIDFELKKVDDVIASFKDEIAMKDMEKDRLIKEQGYCNEKIDQLQQLIDQHEKAKEAMLVEMLRDEQMSQKEVEKGLKRRVKTVDKKLDAIAKEKIVQVLHRRRLAQQKDTLKAFETMQHAKTLLAKKDKKSGKLITAIDILRNQ